ADQSTELGLVLRQWLVQQLLAGAVDPDGVVVTLANVDTDEHVDTVVLGDHEVLPGAVRPSGQAGLSCGLRARHPRYARPANTITRPAWSGPYQRSSGGLSRPGDNTPRIINDWGQRVIPGPTGQPPRPGRFGATKKVTGCPSVPSQAARAVDSGVGTGSGAW